MKSYIYVDIDKAVDLWTKGWCWGALGKHFDCSGSTVKSRIRQRENKELHHLHHVNHNKNCPLCRGYMPSKDQLSLF